MTKSMRYQYGGPWSQIGEGQLHFKFDTVTDQIGRRNKMKLNSQYSDHRDASLLRDQGIEVQSKTIHAANVEKNDEVVDVPNVYSLELDCQMITTTKYFKGSLYLSRDI